MKTLMKNNEKDLAEYAKLMRNLPIQTEDDDNDLSEALEEGADLNELLKEIEQEDRGFYTGIAGYFDGNNLDSCVLIRFLEKDNTYRCGGGITSKSKLKEEYEELIQKMYVPIY